MFGNLGAAYQIGSGALNVYNGVRSGTPTGYAGAALSGISTANRADQLATGSGFLSKGAGAGLGAAGDVLGIYSGIKQGGLAGYGGAAIDAAKLYGAASTYLGGSAAAGAGAAGAGAAGAETAAAAGGGAAAGSGIAAAAGGAALPLALFAAQYGVFEHQSSDTPGQQMMQLNDEIKRVSGLPPSAWKDAQLAQLQGIADLWDPATGSFKQIGVKGGNAVSGAKRTQF
jgi:hypothetical protein